MVAINIITGCGRCSQCLRGDRRFCTKQGYVRNAHAQFIAAPAWREGYHLDRGDLDTGKRLLHVRKGKNYRERFVPLTGPSLTCLQEYLYEGQPYFLAARNEAFFVGHNGRRLSGAAMLLRLQKLIQLTEDDELIGKEVHLHSLRHSIATHLLANGMRLERIAEFLGHSSLESTQLYTHYVQTLQSANHDSELSEVPRVADPEGL